MNVVIADRQVEARVALRLFLNNQSGIFVVGEASNSQELLVQIESIKPDVVLLEWGFPGLPTEVLIPSLLHCKTPPKVIVLGNKSEQQETALAAGADNFICIGDPPKQLLTAIRIAQSEAEGAK